MLDHMPFERYFGPASEAVVAALRERAAAELVDVEMGRKDAITAFGNYVEALATVGPRASGAKTIELMQEVRLRLDCKHDKEQGSFVLDVVDRRQLCAKVNTACENVQSNACQ